MDETDAMRDTAWPHDLGSRDLSRLPPHLRKLKFPLATAARPIHPKGFAMDPGTERLPPAVDLVAIPPAEAEALSEMAGRIWPLAYGGLLPPGQIDYMLAWIYAPATLREEMEGGICFRWIVSAGEKVGFLAYGPVAAGEGCPLHKCYLLAEAEGKGIASEAMRTLVETLAAEGAGVVELRVNRGNARAIAFYRRHGFSINAEDCREIGEGFVMDDFLMRRSLP